MQQDVETKQRVHIRNATLVVLISLGAGLAAFGFISALSRTSETGSNSKAVVSKVRPFVPHHIDSASLNFAWAQQTEIHLDFVRGGSLMGTFNSPGPGIWNEDPAAPLSMVFTTYTAGTTTLPARTMFFEYAIDIKQYQKTVCIPDTVLQPNSTVTYFYDDNGSPYRDESLRQPVLNSSCSSILAKSFKPWSIDQVTLDQPWNHYANLNIDFIRGVRLGYYRFDESVYVAQQDNDSVGDLSPLALAFGSGHAEDITLPARTMTVSYVQSGASYTQVLCIPETTIQAMADQVPVYYFDKNGKPYEDALLLQAVSCGTGGGSPAVMKTSPATQ